MRKATLAIAGIMGLALLSTPALAMWRVISDKFDRATETGVAVVQMERNLYAEIAYKDGDNSHSFTRGDERMKVRYFDPTGRGGLVQVAPASILPKR